MDTLEIIQIVLTLVSSGLMFIGGYTFGSLSKEKEILECINFEIEAELSKPSKGKPTKRANKVKNSKRK